MADHLDPADKVIRSFGGADALGKLLGVHRTQVHRWRIPKTKGGCDGIVPRRHHQRLMDLAREREVALTKDDLAPWLTSGEAA